MKTSKDKDKTMMACKYPLKLNKFSKLKNNYMDGILPYDGCGTTIFVLSRD